jgi:hypothetical protein
MWSAAHLPHVAGEGRGERNAKPSTLSFLRLDDLPADLETAFEERAQPMPGSRLTSGSWGFEDEPLAPLRDKIAAERETLGEVTDRRSMASRQVTATLSLSIRRQCATGMLSTAVRSG